MSPKAPKAPSGLVPRGRGRAFWRAVHVDFDLRPDETEILVEACRILDVAEELQARVVAEGVVVAGRPHPCLVELRLLRPELRRCLTQLGLSAAQAEGLADGGPVASLTSHRARKAAEARWEREGG